MFRDFRDTPPRLAARPTGQLYQRPQALFFCESGTLADLK